MVSGLSLFLPNLTRILGFVLVADENIFIGTPTGSGKTICTEFALLRLWGKREQPRAVCIEPYQEMVDARVKEWQVKFAELQGGKEIASSTGEASADLHLLEKGDACTPTQVRIDQSLSLSKSLTATIVGCHFTVMATTKKCPEHRPPYCG